MAFDEKKWRSARAKSVERLNRYRGLKASDNRQLHDAVYAFYDQLRSEGRQINKGEQPVENTEVVKNLVSELQKVRAFSVRADWWWDNQSKFANLRDKTWDAEHRSAAKRHVKNTGAWSKTTGMPAELRAILKDGRTLESTPGALFLDGLDSGHDRSTPSPSLNYMWGNSSQTFMAESRGTVHADVLRGIDEYSVLKNIEMPELLNMMERGEVDGVTFHVRRRNQQTAVLEEVATYTVSSREDWDQVMPLDRTPSYLEEQNREYATQQVSRSIIRNRMGIQGSLDGFRQILDNANRDPDQVVVATDANTRFSSRVKASREDIAHWERPSGQRLTDRLQYIASAQQTRGSASSRSSGSNQQVPAQSMARASVQTNTTTSSYGSGGYLVPVNTQRTDENLYMSNARSQLPTAGQMFSNDASTVGPPPQFQTPDYEIENPLEHTMSRMTLAPDENVIYERQQYYTPADNTIHTQEPHYNERDYYPSATTSSVMTSDWTQQSAPVGNYTAMVDNPTGNYYDNYEGRQYSTSSASSGFGEPLARTNHVPSPPNHSPSPPPARGRA
ncbi:hypothetical protein [Streptomyces sp. NBC_01518]|uniref:hypothetical protein n=1 Tax=Streptomyces sp. NBC_01518 TaxID=2903891 RepID=UPI00386DC1BE